MEIIKFLKDYWVQIIFVCTFLFACLRFAQAMIAATKCSLRNDILSIYDRCKEKKEITMREWCVSGKSEGLEE